jgi:type VI secretion system secreted protein VgrG
MPEANALIDLATTLGKGKLLIRQFGASEELGRLFEYTVVALSEDLGLDTGSLLGTHATVSLELPDDTSRYFDGIVAAAGLDGARGRRVQYRLVLRPWLWLLTRRWDTRIFQNKSVEDILNAVFSAYEHDVKFELSASYQPIEYCVQYRETDFNFVSRLMEREGLYYYFTHEANRHVMVVVDKPSAHQTFPGADTVPFRETVDAAIDLEAITQWRTRSEVQSSKVTLTDYNFTTPATHLEGSADTTLATPAGALEVYDPPGDFQVAAEGNRYASLRMEEIDARYLRIFGAGNTRGIAVGYRFTLADHPVDSQNAAYLVTSSRIDATHPGYESDQDVAHFSCSFTAIPAAETFRAQRITPRPTVPGPQTAVVVGKSGEEIWTDEYGRIKVQFHWDRDGQNDENSSCWVRVAHAVAGKGFGMIALPRMGQEVVVEFLEGDPDRPLVTGSVYNAQQTVPYTLPDHQTVWSAKSRSSKGGSDTNFNELRFEDEKGKEHVWFQAEKDYYLQVKHDAWSHVGNDQFHSVDHNLQEEIDENVQRTIGKDLKEKVGGAASLEIAKDHAVKVDGEYGLKVGTDLAAESGAKLSLKSGADMVQKVGANLGVDAAANVHIKAGANIVIEAGAMITLKAGGGSVVIGPANVAITGAMVQINSGGGGGSGSGASPKTPKAPEAPEKPKEEKDPLAE